MKKKQEIKAGIIMDLTPEQDLVIGNILHNSQTIEKGIRTMTGMHRQADDLLFKTILEIFPELKDFSLSASLEDEKTIIHVRSRR